MADSKLIDVDDAIETVWMILAGLGYPREMNPQLEQTVKEVFATVPVFHALGKILPSN